MRRLNEMIKQERVIKWEFVSISEYLSSQKRKQYAYMEFHKNGIHVRISSKPCSHQEDQNWRKQMQKEQKCLSAGFFNV